MRVEAAGKEETHKGERKETVKTPRYKATPNGGLIDTRKGYTIGVKEFEVKQSGRIQTVNIVDATGHKMKIARYAIDETDYQFGPAAPARKAAPKASSVQMVAKSTPPRTITIAREDALALLQTMRGLSDMLFSKLVDEAVGK